MSWHIAWRIVRCTSWTRAVDVSGDIEMDIRIGAHLATSRPVSAIATIPRALATASAASTFSDRPLVEMPSATSPSSPRASTCLANTRS